MSADYHHLAKVLDMISALRPEHVVEAGTDDPLYAPLIERYFPEIRLNRKRADLAIYVVPDQDRRAAFDDIRALISTHRGLIVIAPKAGWEKADFAGIAPALFVNDPTGIIAYLGKTEDIKRLRKTLLRQRMRRQSGFTPTIEAVYKIARRKVN